MQPGKGESVLLSIHINYCANSFLHVDFDLTERYLNKSTQGLEIRMEELLLDEYDLPFTEPA